MEKLKPCPLCGQKVRMTSATTTSSGDQLPCIIKCDTCKLILARQGGNEEAVTIWNTRA